MSPSINESCSLVDLPRLHHRKPSARAFSVLSLNEPNSFPLHSYLSALVADPLVAGIRHIHHRTPVAVVAAPRHCHSIHCSVEGYMRVAARGCCCCCSKAAVGSRVGRCTSQGRGQAVFVREPSQYLYTAGIPFVDVFVPKCSCSCVSA